MVSNTKTDVADTVNSHFQPAATYLWYYGSYFVPCHATPPIFAVKLENSPFYINPVDMINHDVVDPRTGMCQVSCFGFLKALNSNSNERDGGRLASHREGMGLIY